MCLGEVLGSLWMPDPYVCFATWTLPLSPTYYKGERILEEWASSHQGKPEWKANLTRSTLYFDCSY